MDLLLTDKTVLITGASGGIGRAMARVFAAEGANLVLHAGRNLDWLKQFIEHHEWRDRAIAVQADVADPAAVEAMFEAAVARFGRVDVCIANAGKWPPEDLALHELPEARLRNTLDINLFGSIWTARCFMKRLTPRPDQHGASLVFIGSTAGRFGERGHVDYSVGKAGLYGLVRTLKNEITRLDPFARVNMIEPGWTVTEMAREALEKPGVVERVVSTMAVRQLGRATDIARVAAFLASPAAARHISGEVLTVAGGMEGRLLWKDAEIDAAAIRRRAKDQA